MLFLQDIRNQYPFIIYYGLHISVKGLDMNAFVFLSVSHVNNSSVPWCINFHLNKQTGQK